MAKTISIFQVSDVSFEGISQGGRPGYTRTTVNKGLEVIDYSVEKIQTHMTEFIDGVQEILSKGARIAGEFRMETVEIQAEISVEGKIGFLGTGAAAKGQSQIKIVFQRQIQKV